jgi:hypothetical protein
MKKTNKMLDLELACEEVQAVVMHGNESLTNLVKGIAASRMSGEIKVGACPCRDKETGELVSAIVVSCEEGCYVVAITLPKIALRYQPVDENGHVLKQDPSKREETELRVVNRIGDN